MATTAPQPKTRKLTIAVLGNPNTGKSTLFSALTGVHARSGNYPGVTVEKKVGWLEQDGVKVQLVDLPGTYSLSPRSLDEMVSVDVLLSRQPDVGPVDAVLCIVDASNLERNLYVVSQVLDLGLPVVLALNMWDVAVSRGMTIDAAGVSQRLGIPVIPCEAHKRKHVDQIKQALLTVTHSTTPGTRAVFPDAVQTEVAALEAAYREWTGTALSPALALRALLDVGGELERRLATGAAQGLAAWLTDARERLKAANCRVPAIEAKVRYAWARDALAGLVQQPAQRAATRSDQLDRYLTHKVVGLVVFCVVMLLVFLSIYAGAEPLMGGLEAGMAYLGETVGGWLTEGPLRSLVVDGVIGGVGGVVTFVPQIALLFLFIALLEDCGYMARAAFLMDKLMTKVGLSGKSFVPLMSSFACAIPGIMATRVIENRRDRMGTLLVAPLMSCSARLPVYVLMIGAFIPSEWVWKWLPLQGVVLFLMQALGALVAIPIAWLLKKTWFQGETPPFVMELPTYKWPSPGIVAARVYDRVRAFIVRAGTLIFATNVLVWALAYYPVDHTEERRLQAAYEQLAEAREAYQSAQNTQALLMIRAKRHLLTAEELSELHQAGLRLAESPPSDEDLNAAALPLHQESQRLLAASYLGRMGHAFEPIVRPLGWDWRIGVGVIASFPAREVIVSTLGTIYSLGGDVGEDDPSLRTALQEATWPDGRPVYSIPVALSVMVFFALCAQCSSTLMVIRREAGHWGWAAFTFVYMTGLAYVGAWLTVLLGNALGW